VGLLGAKKEIPVNRCWDRCNFSDRVEEDIPMAMPGFTAEFSAKVFDRGHYRKNRISSSSPTHAGFVVPQDYTLQFCDEFDHCGPPIHITGDDGGGGDGSGNGDGIGNGGNGNGNGTTTGVGFNNPTGQDCQSLCDIANASCRTAYTALGAAAGAAAGGPAGAPVGGLAGQFLGIIFCGQADRDCRKLC